jgi:hypothetical protein
MTTQHTEQTELGITVGAVRHAFRGLLMDPATKTADEALDLLQDLAEQAPHLIAAAWLEKGRHSAAHISAFRAAWRLWATDEADIDAHRTLRKELDAQAHDAIALPPDPVWVVARHDKVQPSSYNALPYLGAGFVPLPPQQQPSPRLLLCVGPRNAAAWQAQRLHSGLLLRGEVHKPIAECYFDSEVGARDAIAANEEWWSR